MTYRKTLANPCAPVPDTTTLSPYVALGCLSVRHFYWRVNEVCPADKEANKGPLYVVTSYMQSRDSLQGQLFQREFYYLSAYKAENYDQMVGNPKCKQIEWAECKGDGMSERYLQAWESGTTGYPAIDATMR